MKKIKFYQLRQRLADESGANQLLILAILAGMLLIIPVLYDFSSVYYARRVSQTGSDAAVMAAAKDYAEALSITWTGVCYEPPVSVVGRYWSTHVMPIGWSPMGAASASAYAVANRSQLTAYNNYFIRDSKIVDGVTIQYIELYVETEKDINLLVEYGRNFDAPAEATGVVFLDRYERQTIPCGKNGVLYIYTFFWKIRLVN